MHAPDSRRRAEVGVSAAMTATASQSKEQLSDVITRCIDGNDLRRALSTCQHLNRAYPDYAYGWYLASFLMKKARNFPDAVKAIDRALRLAYADKYQLHKAKCLFEGGDLSAAAAAIGVIRDESFDDPWMHGEVGAVLNLLGDQPCALRHYSRAVELDGGNAGLHYSKAALQRYLGDFAGAEVEFNAAIALDPEEFEAYNARAQLRTQTPQNNHIPQLQAVLARTTAPAGIVQLCYALAKELEDVGDHEGAFASLQQGSRTKRQHMRYDVATDLAILARIREVYAASLFDGRIEGFDCADPIFIIGMPRTGTTLVERILGSHSQVCAAGELNEFALELDRLARHLPGPTPASRLDFVAATAGLDFRALGEAYVRRTRAMRDDRPFFIDKLPFNFLYAGLIHLALPRAKIINLRRHPLDTCYAVYKQLFKDAYPFSYDLDELGRYYIAYDELMRHWNSVMPGVIHTVAYEALVADIEGETRRLLEHCGLAWEEACLHFHRNSRASTTASAVQVRQPIYDTSIGKWRHYARQLEPLRASLERAGIATS
jgi:tetratricopeptide (TPR) repeat protein